MADQLGNLGEPVSDRTLVLNLVCGLNAMYTTIGRHIRRGRLFPTFLEAKNDLLLEEITVGASDPDPSTALLAAAAGRPSAPAPQQRSGGSGGGSGPRGESGGATSKTRRSGKRSNRQPKSGGSSSGNGGGSGGDTTQAAPTVPWPTFHNLWTGAIQMWPGPRPQQAAPPPQALLAQQAQQV